MQVLFTQIAIDMAVGHGFEDLGNNDSASQRGC